MRSAGERGTRGATATGRTVRGGATRAVPARLNLTSAKYWFQGAFKMIQRTVFVGLLAGFYLQAL